MINFLLQRILKNKCPICNKVISENSVVVNYGEAKLKVCKKHIKYGDNNEKKNSQIK